MRIKCKCGTENHVADLAEGYVCMGCGKSESLIEQEPKRPHRPAVSDPLGDFR